MGWVSQIQRFSVHDGPGIRTIVFFSGCPLRCQWCQNPENLALSASIGFFADKCIGCRHCLEVCPTGAITLAEGFLHTDLQKCIRCEECCQQCPTEARTISGKQMTVQQVMKEVLRDKVFYQNSNGGVTLSGGEATMQPQFAAEILASCHAENIHTAIETCGYCREKEFLSVIEHTDLVLFDIKHVDPERHRQYTGVSNSLILSNFRRIAGKKQIIVRIPLIPGFNDDAPTLREIADICVQNNVCSVHLLPFHQAGEGKWKAFYLVYRFADIKPLTAEAAEQAKATMNEHCPALNIQLGGG